MLHILNLSGHIALSICIINAITESLITMFSSSFFSNHLCISLGKCLVAFMYVSSCCSCHGVVPVHPSLRASASASVRSLFFYAIKSTFLSIFFFFFCFVFKLAQVIYISIRINLLITKIIRQILWERSHLKLLSSFYRHTTMWLSKKK